MSAFTVSDLATPRLRTLLAQLQPSARTALTRTLADELATRLREHFARRDQEGNRTGFPRTHWWLREARDRTVVRPGSDGTASVEVDSPQFAHRLCGGPITPRAGRRALAIPLNSAAAATTPRSRSDLFLYRAKTTGAPFLAAREAGALRCYWRLVPAVHQDPDPRALPPLSELQAALETRATAEVTRLLASPN